MAGICDRCGGVLKQRSDDSEEIIRNRLREFTAKTKPVVEYFVANAWPVRTIDAAGNMDQIFGRIYAAVLALLEPQTPMAIQLKSPSEIAKLREANLIVAEVLDTLEAAAKPGVATWELNEIAAPS